MRVRVAYVEEPPFYATAPDGSATGADIELADIVLRAVGASAIEYVPTTFGELISGVVAGRWDINVPIFVTPERARLVAFSRPVWCLADGFVVKHGNPKQLTGYTAVAEHADARLGVIPGQVQFDAARDAGVSESKLVTFADQAAAVTALLAREIDVFAATAVGNRAITAEHPELQDVELEGSGARGPVGAFSFRPGDRLLGEVDDALRDYLGTDDHRRRMAAHGFGPAEIDGALGRSA
jgi:polar amino acid transport system substrate-binding protein